MDSPWIPCTLIPLLPPPPQGMTLIHGSIHRIVLPTRKSQSIQFYSISIRSKWVFSILFFAGLVLLRPLQPVIPDLFRIGSALLIFDLFRVCRSLAMILTGSFPFHRPSLVFYWFLCSSLAHLALLVWSSSSPSPSSSCSYQAFSPFSAIDPPPFRFRSLIRISWSSAFRFSAASLRGLRLRRPSGIRAVPATIGTFSGAAMLQMMPISSRKTTNSSGPYAFICTSIQPALDRKFGRVSQSEWPSTSLYTDFIFLSNFLWPMELNPTVI